jgi:hypothetical protein
MSTFRSEQLRQPLNITGSLYGTASYADTASYALNVSAVTYVNDNLPLTGIEIEDYDTNVAVTFTNGTLKFTFGTPNVPTITSFTLNGFETNRFDKMPDDYTANGVFGTGGYTLISASIYSGSTVITSVGTGTTISNAFINASGSQTYWLYVTASNPVGGALAYVSKSISGTLNKTQPGNPTQTTTPLIQLGVYSGNKIEQGATGSIAISSITGSANNWTITSFTATSSFGPTPTKFPLFGNTNGAQGTGTLIVTGSATGSNNIVIATSASYQSGVVLNSSNITTAVYNSITYTKVRSIRYGATTTDFNANSRSDLENLVLWDTRLGGSIGTITGDVGPISNYTFVIDWVGRLYHYIVFDFDFGNITSLVVNNFPSSPTEYFDVISTNAPGSSYKIYKSKQQFTKGSSTDYTYKITIS